MSAPVRPPTERDRFELESRFVIVPMWLLERGVSSRAVHVYALLYSLADREHRTAWPSRKWMADRLGVAVSSVDQPIRELIAARAITRRVRYDQETRAQKSSVYIVHSTPRSPTQPADSPHPARRVGAVDTSTKLSTPTQPADTPHPAGRVGPTQPAGQRTRTTYLDTYSPTEVTPDRARDAQAECPHGEPRGYGYCALCRRQERRRARTPQRQAPEGLLDHAQLAAGEGHDREDDGQ